MSSKIKTFANQIKGIITTYNNKIDIKQTAGKFSVSDITTTYMTTNQDGTVILNLIGNSIQDRSLYGGAMVKGNKIEVFVLLKGSTPTEFPDNIFILTEGIIESLEQSYDYDPTTVVSISSYYVEEVNSVWVAYFTIN